MAALFYWLNTYKFVAFVSMFAIRWHRSCRKLYDRAELRWFKPDARPSHTGKVNRGAENTSSSHYIRNKTNIKTRVPKTHWVAARQQTKQVLQSRCQKHLWSYSYNSSFLIPPPQDSEKGTILPFPIDTDGTLPSPILFVVTLERASPFPASYWPW